MDDPGSTPLGPKRSTDSADRPAEVRLRLLGGLRIERAAREGPAIDASAWHLRKARMLVELLALASGQTRHREEILDILWPDLDLDAAANNLRYALHVARRAIAPFPELRIEVRGDLLRLAATGGLWIDVHAFERAAAAARRSGDADAYAAAIDLYGGDLLPDDRYEDWAAGRREALRDLHSTLLVELARVYEERGATTQAIAALERVVERQPAHEEAQIGLVRLYALSGARGRALRRYRRLEAALRAELDAAPEPESRRLFEAIVAGRFGGALAFNAGAESTQTAAPSEPAPTIRRHNLPLALSSFIGREREMAAVKAGLGRTRLLTLTGSGGCGKTRLALAVAAELVAHYPDGVWQVDLSGLADPALVPGAVARVLGAREGRGRSPIEALTDALRTRSLLLLLDNCEHLIDACAQLAAHLLARCPRLRLLVTSRETLHVPGELAWSVPPLTLPERSRPATAAAGAPPTLAELARSEAARLFIERARLVQPSFSLTESNAQAVLEICRRLDGIPLAIELAAARLPVLGVEGLVERLDDALPLLTTGSRTTLPRQQTLEATLRWSYDLLPPQERAVLRRLSVFAGSFALDAAEAVCAGDGVEQPVILPRLAQLVDKSLLFVEELAGEMRYRLLETVRQYGRERLREHGESDAVEARHAAYYLALAEDASGRLMGPELARWLDRLELEHDNLRAALRRLIARGDGEAALRLAGSLGKFWWVRGYLAEGGRWLDDALRAGGGASLTARARALQEAGSLARDRTDYERAEALQLEALALSRAAGDRHGIGWALAQLGTLARHHGDFARARELMEEGLALLQETGDRWGVGWTLGDLGLTARLRGDLAHAERLLEDYVRVARELDDRQALGWALAQLGDVVRLHGDIERAERLLEESRGLSLAVRYTMNLAMASLYLGALRRQQGRLSHAGELLDESLELFASLGDKRGIRWAKTALGLTARDRGDYAEAAGLLADSLDLAVEIQNPLSARRLLGLLGVLAIEMGELERGLRLIASAHADPSPASLHPDDRQDHEAALAAARAGLSQAARDAAWQSGRAMPVERAIGDAQAWARSLPASGPRPDVPEPPGQPAAASAPRARLSQREREIAGLVARGLTNTQIAGELGIAAREVDMHLGTILRKLDAHSRAEIAARVAERPASGHGLRHQSPPSSR